jgi:hypothetical protein
MSCPIPDRDLWSYASTFLPRDLDALGRANGIARLRGFESVSDLLRVILAWSQPGSSFQTAAAWSKASGVADVTPEALFYRVRESERFLGTVMGQMLAGWREIPCARRLMIVDATILTGPASRGTDWRVHMLYDPTRAVPCGVEVSDARQGETLARHDLRRGDLVLADRGYGHFRGFISALTKGADVLVRVEPGQMKVFELDGERTYLEIMAQKVPSVGSADFELVWHGPDRDCRKVRIIGTRTTKGDVCWLATNLSRSALPNAQAAELYRVRWQIELLFKRMKTLLEMDDLRSREGPTAKAFIYAKLITAFLALRLSDESEDFSPYGYEIRNVAPTAQSVEGVQVRPRRRRRRDSRRRKMDQKTQTQTAPQRPRAKTTASVQ